MWVREIARERERGRERERERGQLFGKSRRKIFGLKIVGSNCLVGALVLPRTKKMFLFLSLLLCFLSVFLVLFFLFFLPTPVLAGR